MGNRTHVRRRQVLGQLKGDSKNTEAIAKALGNRPVRKLLRSLERSKLVAREGERKRGEPQTWTLTADGESWLEAHTAG